MWRNSTDVMMEVSHPARAQRKDRLEVRFELSLHKGLGRWWRRKVTQGRGSDLRSKRPASSSAPSWCVFLGIYLLNFSFLICGMKRGLNESMSKILSQSKNHTSLLDSFYEKRRLWKRKLWQQLEFVFL